MRLGIVPRGVVQSGVRDNEVSKNRGKGVDLLKRRGGEKGSGRER